MIRFHFPGTTLVYLAMLVLAYLTFDIDGIVGAVVILLLLAKV